MNNQITHKSGITEPQNTLETQDRGPGLMLIMWIEREDFLEEEDDREQTCGHSRGRRGGTNLRVAWKHILDSRRGVLDTSGSSLHSKR